jgi:hypothetical protein
MCNPEIYFCLTPIVLAHSLFVIIWQLISHKSTGFASLEKSENTAVLGAFPHGTKSATAE